MKEESNQEGSQKSTKEKLKESFKGALVEEKIWLYWKHFKKHFFLFGIFIVIVLLGIQGIGFYKKRQIEKLQEAFREAKENKQELAFAERHPREPLSGVVFLEVADEHYRGEKYDEAFIYYAKAEKALKKTPQLIGRTRLGAAMATIMGGDKGKGESLLISITQDKKQMGVVRGEAAFQLTILALEAEDYDQAKEYFEDIKEIPNAGIWVQKSIFLESAVPELTH